MVLKRGEQIFPGLEDEVALEQAKGTISNLVDAVVELVTNSDDSYLSIEQDGGNPSGKVEIYIKKAKENKLLELTVTDEALGMTPEKLEKIIRYGKKTSDIYAGKSVRGFFGRGLKESIIALGTGEILTTAEGKRTYGKYYYDLDKSKLVWHTLDEGSKTKEGSGTKITITAYEDIKCPEFDTIFKKIRDHFALSDVLGNMNRSVKLTIEKLGYKDKKINGPKRIWYESPIGNQIEKKNIYFDGFGVADFKLYESSERLYFSRNDPGSQAGIRIRTSNATLENQLFGFDNDPYAHYFFGEIRCPGIFEKVKEKEKGLIRSDRKGLYWNQKYCVELEKKVKKILSHHIERKKKQAESQKTKQEMPEERAKKFKRLIKKLNSLGRELLSDIGPGPYKEPIELEIKQLTIHPSESIAPPMDDRIFGVYNLFNSIKDSPKVEISLDNPKGKFVVSSNAISLKKHRQRAELAVGYFKIRGFRSQDKTGIIVRQGKEEDLAEFAVGIKTKKPSKERKGGLFKGFNFDIFDKDPPQRVYYDEKSGIVTVYILYPGISPYLGENGEGSESEKGSLLLSELIAEAFCRATAVRMVGSDIFGPEAQLYQYLKIYNENLKKCIPVIHGIFLS